MKRILYVTMLVAVAVQFNSCISQTEEPAGVMVYPNPYNPTQGFLNIKDSNGNSLGANVKLFVYNFNLTEVYNGTLVNDQYAGINASGDHLPPGIYFLKIVVVDGTAEKVTSERYRLVVQ